ncbi:hypothetical protein KUTeg_023086 [Tegillarca granosa]|uniref:Uncharacterized protein n=1 Tax=Tegillarca granosa TaxID=220873 RepID=A0ABQ9E3P6_TEGGR|nr:hypothetical protein KUTeg_023086 [Tegillarca granosa]
MATDNYMDCQADEMVAVGTTECCTRDKVVGCCKPNARWDKMIAIGCGIGVTFVVLALILIYLIWCKKDTIPCLGRCQDRIERKYYALEEKMWYL